MAGEEQGLSVSAIFQGNEFQWQPDPAANLPTHLWLKGEGWVSDGLSSRAGHWQQVLGAMMDGGAGVRRMGKTDVGRGSQASV